MIQYFRKNRYHFATDIIGTTEYLKDNKARKATSTDELSDGTSHLAEKLQPQRSTKQEVP